MTATLVIDIDPKLLADYPGNVRKNTGDIEGLTATVKEYGVLNPLLVSPVNGNADGPFQVIAGKRRLAAAIKAGRATVPCIVRADLDEQAEKVSSLIENVQRKDLTSAEEADGWRQLELAGLDAAAIAKVSGVDATRVETGLQVAKSKTAAAVTKKYELTLEQAAAIAEFDDDKDAVKNLAATAVKDPGRFEHVVSRMRQDRERARAIAEKEAELQAAGVKLYKGQTGWKTSGPMRLADVVDPERRNISDAAHKDCPGHAVQVTADWDGKVHAVSVCMNPAKHGHKDRYSGGSSSRSKPEPGSKEAEKAKAERRKVLDENKAWRAAEPVRRDFIRGLLARKTAPAQVLPFVMNAVLGEPNELAPMSIAGTEKMLTELTGVEPGKTSFTHSRFVGLAIAAKSTTPGRMPLAMLAQVAATRELDLDPATARCKFPRHVRWMQFLIDVGYTPADVELQLLGIKKAAKK